ncbi:MAG: homoserine kinase [Firmicutes bacterium]|jgi:homoserine kinase|nr:homoserine kinase [Bacillota bacterium]
MKVKVKVPASSANIGPGFDCLGLAVNLYLYIEAEETGETTSVKRCPNTPKEAANLLQHSMEELFNLIDYKPKGLKLNIENEIPIARGLGSSSAYIVGGIVAAAKLAEANLSQQDLLNLAAKIEGHPDNITPCLNGGLTASFSEDGKVYASKLDLHPDFQFFALIPNFHLSTKVARGALPQMVSHSDASFNTSRTVLTLAALKNGDADLLKASLDDKLHQNYRIPLIPEYDKLFNSLQEIEEIACYLSGAGPTIMVITKESEKTEAELQKALNNLENPWGIKKLHPDLQGAVEL